MSTAEPNPGRPLTLMELSSCANCSRIVQRFTQADGVLIERPWEHRGTGLLDCEEADVEFHAKAVRGQA